MVDVLRPLYLWLDDIETTLTNQRQRTQWTVPGTATFFATRSARALAGKVYCEFRGGSEPGAMSRGYGVADPTVGNVFYSPGPGGYVFSGNGGCGLPSAGFQNAASRTATSLYAFTTTDIIGLAFDATTRELWVSKNGVWLSGNPGLGTSPTMTLAASGPFHFAVSAYSCGISSGVYSYDIFPSVFSQTYPVPSGFEPYQPDLVGATVSFPEGLPPPLRNGYRETFEEIRTSVEMESGSRRSRNRRRSAPRRFDLSLSFTQAQFTQFDQWWQNAILGGEREFDIQLLDDDDADALVWYSVRVVGGTYELNVTPELLYLVNFTVRAVGRSFAERNSLTDELSGVAQLGLRPGTGGQLRRVLFLRGGTALGLQSASAKFRQPLMQGISFVGLRSAKARFSP